MGILLMLPISLFLGLILGVWLIDDISRTLRIILTIILLILGALVCYSWEWIIGFFFVPAYFMAAKSMK